MAVSNVPAKGQAYIAIFNLNLLETRVLQRIEPCKIGKCQKKFKIAIIGPSL